MAMFLSQSLLGNQQIAMFGLPDTTARQQPGTIVTAASNYWGGAEFIYAKAGGSIRQFGICVLTPAVSSGAYAYSMTEVPNTAHLGRSVYIAMTVMTSGQFGWFMQSGITPVNCSASVAADTAFGIAAAGQGGAIANGKQISNARVIVASTATVAKTNCVANSGSTLLQVPNVDGWFAGIYLSGTGIQAGTTVTDIYPDKQTVLISATTSAAVSGTITGTYNNATVYYNVAHLNRPFAQGQVT